LLPGFLQRSAPIWLGFFLTVNLYLIPTSSGSPRLTDGIAVGLALWLLVLGHRRGLPAASLSILAIANALPLCWFAYALWTRDMGTVTQMARWLLAVPWALGLLEILREREEQQRFLWGLWLGGMANVGVVGMQYLGLEAPLRPLGISMADTETLRWYGAQARFSGLHRHYGASAAVASLLAPVSMVLYFSGRRGIWLPLVSLLGIGVVSHLTFTRSPAIATIVTVIVAILSSRRVGRSATLASCLLIVGIPALAIFGPPGGKVRWSDNLTAGANLRERATSNRAAAELIVENPFGLGVAQGRARLLERSSIPATHNAFLQAGLYVGLPLALILVLVCFHQMWGLLRGVDHSTYWKALLSVHLLGLFLFEEHLNNPTFVILVSWLVALSAARVFGPDRESA